jgi:hypothetical protein
MNLLFEDLAWLVSRSSVQAELDVEEAACLWKSLRDRPRDVLEIGRRSGDSTAVMAASLTGGSIESYSLRESLADDVDAFLKSHGIRRRVILRRAIRPATDCRTFGAIVVHLEGTYLPMLVRLLIGWCSARVSLSRQRSSRFSGVPVRQASGSSSKRN